MITATLDQTQAVQAQTSPEERALRVDLAAAYRLVALYAGMI